MVRGGTFEEGRLLKHLYSFLHGDFGAAGEN